MRETCARWRTGDAAPGLTTRPRLPGRLAVMNDNARRPRSFPDDSRPGTRPTPKPRPVSGESADHAGTDEDAAWLNRLALALTAGLIVAAPRTAFLVIEVLGPPVPRSTSTSTGQVAEPRTKGDRRTDA